MARPSRYALELRRRAVRMIADHPNETAALQAVADELGIASRETLRTPGRSTHRSGLPSTWTPPA